MWQRNHEITAARALWRTSIFLPVWSPSVPQVSNNILARGLTKYGKIAFATRNVRYSHLYNISYIQNSWFFFAQCRPPADKTWTRLSTSGERSKQSGNDIHKNCNRGATCPTPLTRGASGAPMPTRLPEEAMPWREPAGKYCFRLFPVKT